MYFGAFRTPIDQSIIVNRELNIVSYNYFGTGHKAKLLILIFGKVVQKLSVVWSMSKHPEPVHPSIQLSPTQYNSNTSITYEKMFVVRGNLRETHYNRIIDNLNVSDLFPP